MSIDHKANEPNAEDAAWQEYLANFGGDRMRWYHWPRLLIDDSLEGNAARMALAAVLVLVTLFFLRDYVTHFAEGLVGK